MPNTDGNLDELLQRNLKQTLRGNAIDIGEGPLCMELLSILKRFLGQIARQFQSDIDRLMSDQQANHKKHNLDSWVVSEMATVQAITFSRFYSRICEAEGMNPGQHRVDCVVAHSHAYLLAQLFQEAFQEWRSDRCLEPASPKARRKRSARDWFPWMIDVIFSPEGGGKAREKPGKAA